MEKYPVIKIQDGDKYFYRFTLNQRIQHVVLAVTVVLLVLTGMPLKFHDASWAPYLYALFGGIKYAPLVHKINGAILMGLFFYHIGYLIYVIRKYHIEPKKQKGELEKYGALKIVLTQGLVPNLKDAFDIRDLLKYLLFFTNKRPDGDNFTWKEKFDYWAPFWGMVIIGFSGLILWNKELFTQILPGGVLNFLLIAHSDEALLAALFLFIWHWYNVHFSTSVFPMGTVFITGYLSEELMVEEHYQYYVEVMKKAGLENEILPPHGGPAHGSHEGGHSS
jgi:cytochrome b subunit of formate dehydrogenase